MAKCKSCDAPIIWLKHQETGKTNPFNAYPMTNGNCVIDKAAGTYRQLTKGEDYEGDRYLSHFATCRNAASHKKSR